MEKKFEAPLKLAIEVLEKHGYRYALIGGLILGQWGKTRTTEDIDIKVLVTDFDYKKIKSILQANFPDTARMKAPKNQYIAAYMINDVIVDFLLALPGYEELIIERAIQIDTSGWKVWICSPEDLIIQKMVAGRQKDIDDVLSILIRQQGKLDNKYIQHWLIQFSEALENPDLLRIYQRLLDEAAIINSS